MRLAHMLCVLAPILPRHVVAETIDGKVTPRVMIISMWTPESHVWHRRFHESRLGNLSSLAVPLPGLSMLFPHVFCTEDGRVCQATVGEGEINSAVSMTALVLAKAFDLRRTYFLIAGIAGVNPRLATIGSVALARFAVQVALQYEIDARSLPPDWPTGYIPYGRRHPLEYPCITYGTEVFEVSQRLRDISFELASRAVLSDEEGPRNYRARYAGIQDQFAMATRPPSVVKCDSATSDVYYSGTKLAQAFENTTRVWTNGTGVHCMSAQEDTATLEVLVRAAVEGLADFSRVILMRSGTCRCRRRPLPSPSCSRDHKGSNFDRPPPDMSDLQHLTGVDQNGMSIAVDNLFNAGIEIVKSIVGAWNCTFGRGVPPTNYIGDIFGSLGGHPDFGLGSITNGKVIAPAGKGGNLARLEMARRAKFASQMTMP
ncbi:purine nucleoside permease [Drechmeria coniospora]|uniref:Purine nucleoside permease n=1 Tax=Drechmeria coniospora TaxID=98403 RepID=A0A151GKU7_DRECN|nr:purine nucleoside permease [Drechmeria coniospora]KYK57661.1 purine nucleoside permease [Drechmeria coniospora]